MSRFVKASGSLKAPSTTQDPFIELDGNDVFLGAAPDVLYEKQKEP
jgi:hypothetical protein